MIDAIAQIIADAESSRLSPVKKASDGFSGQKILQTLQALCRLYATEPDACYLEVGVYRGLTLLNSAQAAPELPCYGIDNFKFFDVKQKNQSIIEQRREELSLQNVYLINADYEEAITHLASHIGERKVAIYWIDGPHDYRSQLMCLLLIKPYLHPQAVILIDDCNYAHVRQANHDFLVTNSEFKLLYESYTKAHPLNMTDTQKEAAQQGWWDGINIMVCDPNNTLLPFFPQLSDTKEFFGNDHVVHSSKVAPYAIHAVNFFSYLLQNKLPAAGKQFYRLLQKYHHSNQKAPFGGLNTYMNSADNVKMHPSFQNKLRSN